jgi:hypothetical protein
MEITKVNQLITKLNRYFVHQILQENYTIKHMSHASVIIQLHSEHEFALWIANEPRNFECYNGRILNFMTLDFNEDEKKLLHARFNKIWNDEYNRPENIEQRRKKYEALKAEFELSPASPMSPNNENIKE